MVIFRDNVLGGIFLGQLEVVFLKDDDSNCLNMRDPGVKMNPAIWTLPSKSIHSTSTPTGDAREFNLNTVENRE